MPLIDAAPFGDVYAWGFGAEDAPEIEGFVPISGEFKWESKRFAALDNEGEEVSVVLSKQGKRKITGEVVGYLKDGYNPATIANNFSFQERRFLIRGISKPTLRAKYVELTLSAESYPNIN